jgi:hypothetical protein
VNHAELVLGVALATALAALLLSARTWRRSRRARQRAQRALAGEASAERLLTDNGFAVIERQVSVTWELRVNGAPRQVPLRVDLLVERGGRRYVAEVKTGAEAPRVETAATRRQLLEYRLALPVAGVLLVSPEGGHIQEVEFPLPTIPGKAEPGPTPGFPLWAVAAGIAIGAVTTALLLR